MTAAIIATRMGSKRLPNKLMREIAGRPMLEWVIYRLRRAKSIDHIILSAPNEEENEPIRFLADRVGVSCHMVDGDPNDVLGRVLKTMDRYGVDNMVRITGDCVLVDPDIVDAVVGARGFHEFSTNVMHRTFAKGMDVECATRECLERVDKLCHDDRREHVTLYIYRNAYKFDVKEVFYPTNESEIIMCVDYPEDFEVAKRVIEWNPDATYPEILRFVKDMHESEVGRIPSFSGSATGSH